MADIGTLIHEVSSSCHSNATGPYVKALIGDIIDNSADIEASAVILQMEPFDIEDLPEVVSICIRRADFSVYSLR
jgi:hypothetical protein